MLSSSISKLVIVVGVLALLTSCQNLGPFAIEQGRNRYNNIIQSTSKEQVLSNIVRVFNHEPISVTDVTEVDASQSFVSSINGAITNIGAHKGTTGGTLAGQLASVTGNTQYSETPTIRYQPLLGQALVAQLVTPVNPDALGLLYDSSWKVTPLLDLASSYLTLDYSEFYVALNVMSELYSSGALEFVAAKSDLGKAAGPTRGNARGESPAGSAATQAANRPAGNDALDIYLQPFHPHEPRREVSERRRELQLWIRLLWIYYGTQPKFVPKNPARCTQIGLRMTSADLAKWDSNLKSDRREVNLDEIRNCLPNFIELRTISVSPEIARSKGFTSGAPLMRTYSALGILKNATERPHPKIAFVSHDLYRQIRAHAWNQDVDSLSFYTLLPEDENPLDNPVSVGHESESARLDREVTNWIQGPQRNLFVYEPSNSLFDSDYIKGNRRLGLLRRYILVIVDDIPPTNAAYVFHFDHGKWYYIDSDDVISQKNFNLISLFLTMMAIPSAAPPLSPVISVGGM